VVCAVSGEVAVADEQDVPRSLHSRERVTSGNVPVTERSSARARHTPGTERHSKVPTAQIPLQRVADRCASEGTLQAYAPQTRGRSPAGPSASEHGARPSLQLERAPAAEDGRRRHSEEAEIAAQ
jgi:hypothetical protein